MANPSIQLGTNSNWAVKEDKLLAYKEYNDYFFNKEFDFSRGTSATYVAKDGLIKTAGIQPNIVNNGDFSELGSELVTNGDFTDWTADNPDGWTVLNEDANNYVTQDGTYARIVSNDTASIQIKQTIFTIGKTYKVELDAVVNSGNVEGLKLNDATAPATIGYVNSTGHHTFYFKAAGTAFVINRKGGGDTDISIDNVSVKEVAQNWTVANEDANNYVEFNQEEGTVRLKFLNTSPITTLSSATQYLSGKTYKLTVDVKEVVSGSIKVDAAGVNETFNSVGIQQRIIEPTGNATINFYRASANVDITLNSVSLQEIQTDTPRIDFTNDTKGHLLLEPQSTNLLTYSEALDNYSNSNTVCTPNFAISPDGTQNATKVDFTASFTNRLGVNGAVNSGETVTQSIFVKYIDAQYVQLWFGSSGFSGVKQTNFDLINGTASNSVGTIQSLQNGWYRITCKNTATSTASSTGIFNLVVVNSFSATRFGDEADGSVLAFGGQYEKLSYATSYIPTTGAGSTRNADICNNSGSAQDFNSEEGVLYAEIAALESTFSGSKFISISDGTYNNRASILFSTGATNKIRTFLRVGGVSQVDKSGNVTDVKDFNKVAFSYKENEFKMFINGSQVGSPDTSGSVWSPGTITKLSLTEINSALGAFNGKVRNVKVFTEAFTDAELQELTS